MSLPFDATLKEIVGQHPNDLRSVFRFPDAFPVRTLNADLSTLTALTDVAFGFGQPMSEIVDLNFQSGTDPRVASRLHLYSAALHFKYGVPVRSILVLLRSKASVPGLNGKLSYGTGDKRLRFEYDVVRLWKQPVEPFLQGGIGLLPLAPLCKLPPGKSIPNALRDVVREIDRRLALAPDHAEAVRLMTATFILTGMRVPKRRIADIFDGVRIMHESTAYDAVLDEGRLQGQIRLILLLGRDKFGPADATTEAALAAVDDLDRLERMGRAILAANSWQELLSTY